MSKPKFTYLMFDGINYKIGQTSNVQNRLKSLQTANINIRLICFGTGI